MIHRLMDPVWELSPEPAKSTFKIEDCPCFQANIDNEGCPCANASGEIHIGFGSAVMLNKLEEFFGKPLHFLNGTFYFVTYNYEDALKAENVIRAHLERVEKNIRKAYIHSIISTIQFPSAEIESTTTPGLIYQIKFQPLSLNIDKTGSGRYLVKLRTNSVARAIDTTIMEPNFRKKYDPWFSTIEVKERLI